MTWDAVIFDLDGTIVDSAAGILGSLHDTMRDLGLPDRGDEELRYFIGPPIHDSFIDLFGMTLQGAIAATGLYRSHYRDGGGILRFTAFPGVPELIRDLHANGTTLALATSKPESSALIILDRLGITDQFDAIAGASEDESISEKAEIIAIALERLDAVGKRPAHPVMVGDRVHDVEGSAVNDIPCIRVLWGFGDDSESAGTIAQVRTPDELRRLLATGLDTQPPRLTA